MGKLSNKKGQKKGATNNSNGAVQRASTQRKAKKELTSVGGRMHYCTTRNSKCNFNTRFCSRTRREKGNPKLHGKPVSKVHELTVHPLWGKKEEDKLHKMGHVSLSECECHDKGVRLLDGSNGDALLCRYTTFEDHAATMSPSFVDEMVVYVKRYFDKCGTSEGRHSEVQCVCARWPTCTVTQ